MTHREFRRIRSDANTAALFIHGINGTPNHFRDFVKLVPPEFSVVNMLLKGHGGGVEDFAGASMEEWKSQVEEAVESLLERHDALLIAAHSMGTLFAIEQAIKRPDRVKALFLLAVPLKPFVKPRMLRNIQAVHSGRGKENDPWTQAVVNAYGIEPDPRFWKYIPWIERYLELLREIRHVRGQLDALRTPCYCYQSKKDELVSLSTCKILGENGFVNLHVLEESGHFYYGEKDRRRMTEDFGSFIRDMK